MPRRAKAKRHKGRGRKQRREKGLPRPHTQSRNNWRTSAATMLGTTCVEVAFDGSTARVRDSKDRSGPILSFSSDDWTRFLAGLK